MSQSPVSASSDAQQTGLELAPWQWREMTASSTREQQAIFTRVTESAARRLLSPQDFLPVCRSPRTGLLKGQVTVRHAAGIFAMCEHRLLHTARNQCLATGANSS